MGQYHSLHCVSCRRPYRLRRSRRNFVEEFYFCTPRCSQKETKRWRYATDDEAQTAGERVIAERRELIEALAKR